MHPFALSSIPTTPHHILSMRSSVLLSLLLTAVYEVAAFEKTSPFLAWSSNG